jgi:hypothetical protein
MSECNSLVDAVLLTVAFVIAFCVLSMLIVGYVMAGVTNWRRDRQRNDIDEVDHE